MLFSCKRSLLSILALTALLTMGTAYGAGRYVLISHAPDSDSWWNMIKNSIKQAGEDYNVTVDYRNPPSGDLADMARLIEQAAAAGYDGVIVTIADFNVLQGAHRQGHREEDSADHDQLRHHRAEREARRDHARGPARVRRRQRRGRARQGRRREELPVRQSLRDEPGELRALSRLCGSDRRRLQEVDARLGRRSDDDRIESRRVSAPESRHQRRADARTDVGQPDDQGARKDRDRPARCGWRPSICPTTSARGSRTGR